MAFHLSEYVIFLFVLLFALILICRYVYDSEPFLQLKRITKLTFSGTYPIYKKNRLIIAVLERVLHRCSTSSHSHISSGLVSIRRSVEENEPCGN